MNTPRPRSGDSNPRAARRTNVGHRLATAFGDRYTIECELGQGSMGVVYRARDKHLDRPVALKVLHHDGAGLDELLVRFGREAKILASINNPSIAAIHGCEVAGDTHVLVLELIEGVTLRERLEQKPMPVGRVITVCAAIAVALKSAHDLGIIHCDLKPENVKVTPDGSVKVLDFGTAMRVGTSSGRISWPQICASTDAWSDRVRSGNGAGPDAQRGRYRASRPRFRLGVIIRTVAVRDAGRQGTARCRSSACLFDRLYEDASHKRAWLASQLPVHPPTAPAVHAGPGVR